MAGRKTPGGSKSTASRKVRRAARSERGPVEPGGADAERALPFPIVCAGASAGGIEALSQLLGSVPADTGMAFVVVLHLAPAHESLLADILGRHTRMPVRQVGGDTPVEPDHVYVIPPGKQMRLSRGRLKLSPRDNPKQQARTVDHFMRSLAEEHGHKAIGVILSGTANDGTQGLEEIKAAGGITFAQDATAEQSGMPRNAIASGSVDYVLPPDEIGREIGRIARHPYVASGVVTPEERQGESQIGRVLELLRHGTGVDFANYKRNTLHRRITRRMVLQKLDGLPDYVRFMQANAGELQALYQDILIGVTSFFRNPEAFETLKQKVFPALAADKGRHDPVRVWALGCSTGEEAYSLAMAFTEWSEENGRRVPMQVFATDLNGLAIERARAGVYPKSIAQDVSADRLRRFFVEVDGSYRITKSIRDICVFARQNVMADPPFSRLDLIACRNMLIYLEPVLQQKLLPMLHYALRPSGYLWLGSSETIGSFRDLFELEDNKHKIYAKKGGAARIAQIPIAARSPDVATLAGRIEVPVERGLDPQKEADRMLLARYAPPAVVLNPDLDIVQFRGDTSPYLMSPPGRASHSLLKMLREGLMVPVRGAVHKARRKDLVVRETGLKVKSNGGYREVNVVVMPMKGGGVPKGSLLVMFEEPALSAEVHARNVDAQLRAATEEKSAPKETVESEVARLKQELGATRDYLQSVIEQQEAANEELQSANEEVQSANEELQSINEELETSKEEIQSSNEELATVNDELHNRNLELSQSNNDLNNLLSSVNMPILMLGRDLRIRRFTPAAEKVFNLIPGDVGRPIGDIQLRLRGPDLEPLLAETIETVSVRELEVQDQKGHWYLMRLRPYLTLENRIDGAVMVLVDVDRLKRAEQSLREGDRGKNEFLAMLAHELRNPLAALRSALDVASGAAGAAQDPARGVMDRQVEHMTQLVDDLLDASRISQGAIKLRLAPMDLVAVLREALEATAHERAELGHKLQADLPPKPVGMNGDATRLEQVFCNLLRNAAKFTPRGTGRLRVTLAAGRTEATVRIADNGDGIDGARLPRVFDLFASTDRSLDRRHGGLGIGLALSRKLVELHGGTIEARSDGPGKGSEFAVQIPLG